MKTWTQFTEELTEDDLLLIIKDWNEFKANSSIGDCFLRSKAVEWSANIKSECFEIIAMNDLANFAFQYFANKYFDVFGIQL